MVKTFAIFDALLLAGIILATRIGCALHEAGGHALLAHLFGARVRMLEITLFAGGWCDWHYDVDRSTVFELIPTLAGMGSNLLTGLIALPLVRRVESRPIAAPLLAMFAAGSILLPIAYLIIGLYYGEGDPAQILSLLTGRESSIPSALMLLAAAPIIAWWAVRPYSRIQQAHFPRARATERVVVFALTVGLALIAYFALYVSSDRLMPQHMIVFDAANMARAKAAPPPPFPIIPGLALAYLAGAVAAIRRPDAAPSAAPLRPRAVMLLSLAAIGVLALIAALHQRFI